MCDELSSSSNFVTGSRDGDVIGRGGLLSGFIGGRRRLSGYGAVRVSSSNCSNAGFGHPKTRGVLTVTERHGVRYVVIGSLSHFNEGCVRINKCIRRIFPFLNVEFVSIGSFFSDGAGRTTNSLSVKFGGLVRDCCPRRASEGMSRNGVMLAGVNGFISSFTFFKCIGSGGSGEGVMVSRPTTRVIECVFGLELRKLKVVRVTEQLGTRGMVAPVREGERLNRGIFTGCSASG